MNSNRRNKSMRGFFESLSYYDKQKIKMILLDFLENEQKDLYKSNIAHMKLDEINHLIENCHSSYLARYLNETAEKYNVSPADVLIYINENVVRSEVNICYITSNFLDSCYELPNYIEDENEARKYVREYFLNSVEYHTKTELKCEF